MGEVSTTLNRLQPSPTNQPITPNPIFLQLFEILGFYLGEWARILSVIVIFITLIGVQMTQVCVWPAILGGWGTVEVALPPARRSMSRAGPGHSPPLFYPSALIVGVDPDGGRG